MQRPLIVPGRHGKIVTREALREAQQKDPSLKRVREMVQSGKENSFGSNTLVSFHGKKGLIYRHYKSSLVEQGRNITQLVVPNDFRKEILKLGHDSIMAGHLGIKKTTDKIFTQFYWPGMHGEIERYCRSCDICQKTASRGRVNKVPLGTMPLMSTPFQMVAVDLIGKIQPSSERGHKYILVLVDYATRYPEATALKHIDAESVAEALVDMYSRIGVPATLLSDMGTQFLAEVMGEVSRLLSIRRLTTTPYHPQCNGLVEKFNGTLKSMLKKMCRECPRDWDRYISPLLFAYREAPQASLGFSPFELLYGRTVRGPMTILRELWTSEDTDPEVKTTYEYVLDLRDLKPLVSWLGLNFQSPF